MTALYAGLDVSLEPTSVCVVDEEGRMVRETKVASKPDAITRELRSLRATMFGLASKLGRFRSGCVSGSRMQVCRWCASRRAMQSREGGDEPEQE